MVAEEGHGGVTGAASHAHGDADGRLPYPLFTVACQLILQVLGLQLQLGPLFDLLLALRRQLLFLLFHSRDLRLQFSDDALRLLQKTTQTRGHESKLTDQSVKISSFPYTQQLFK